MIPFNDPSSIKNNDLNTPRNHPLRPSLPVEVTFARQWIFPVISNEAGEALSNRSLDDFAKKCVEFNFFVCFDLF